MIRNLLGLCILFIMTGCTEEVFENTSYKFHGEEYYASFEGTDTRTYVDEQIRMRWTAKDKITLFKKNTYSREFMFTGKTGANAGGFRQISVDDEYWFGYDVPNTYAVYPHSAEAALDETDLFLTVNMPAEQTYVENSFGLGANTMVAISSDNQLIFKNVGSYLRVRLYGVQTAISSITLTSKGEEAIAGEAKVTPVMDGNPTCEMLGTEKSIRLVCPNPVTISSDANNPTEFWIVVPPVTLGSGFSVTIEDSDENKQVYNVDKSFTFKRNVHYQLTREVSLTEVPYITFSADAEQTFSISQEIETLEYSVNGSEWTKLGTSVVNFGGDLGKLQLRGKSLIGTSAPPVSNPETDCAHVLFGNATQVACSGDIRTLVDYHNYETVDTSKASFCFLFMDCYNLITAPELPATILAESCYMGMFAGCTNLTSAPALPATTLTGACYFSMFHSCTNLSKAPDLLATTDGGNSYENMFYGCSSLNYLKVMLTTRPYYGMLNNMAPIGTIVVNRAATWIEPYYIPANWTIKYEGESSWTNENTPYLTFSSDSRQTLSLDIKWPYGEYATDYTETIEYSVDGSIWQDLDHEVTFGGITGNLKLRSKNPYGTAKAEVRTDGSSPDHFIYGLGYTYIQSITTIVFGTESKVSCTGDIRTLVDYENYETTDCSNARFYNLFYNADVLTSAPELPLKTLATYCYSGMFNGCTSLATAPELPVKTLTEACYEIMFRDCTSLTKVPELPATTLAEACYLGMFEGCTSLTTPPILPATTLAHACYGSMFSDCTSLTTAPILPATTLVAQCYSSMFSNCESLTKAPDLLATTLAEGCYSQMFINCHKLSYIKMMATDISAKDCLSGWTWMLGESSTGTFVKHINAQWDESKVIPEGWTVTTAN